MKRASQLQREVNETYDHKTNVYAIGVFREALMLLEESHNDDNERLNLLFSFIKNSSRDKNLLLAASIANSDRITQPSGVRPVALYFKAIRCASSFMQKVRICGLILIALIKPTNKSIFIYPHPIE